MNYDKQYYILERENNDNHPLLEWDDLTNPTDGGEFSDDEPIVVKEPVNLVLGEPIPDSPELVDFHSWPPDVFTYKVASVLEEMKLYKTQLFDARITHNGRVTKGYKIFHVYGEIRCMNLERSIYKPLTSSYIVEKLSLDEDTLSEISEEVRLVFYLEEQSSTLLYHEKVVNRIMKVNPVGLQFIRLDEWDIGSAFR